MAQRYCLPHCVVFRVDVFAAIGMSVAVPSIGDPRDQLLETLPFVHKRARDQCHSAIRQMLDATAEQENVQIILNLTTLNGPTLLAMVANIVRTKSNAFIIFTGREVDPRLAGFLLGPEPLMESDADVRLRYVRNGSVSEISSVTLPSDVSSSVCGDGQLEHSNSALRRGANEEPVEPQRAGRLDHNEARIVLQSPQNRAEEQLHWDSDGSSTRVREACLFDACAITGLLNMHTKDIAVHIALQERRLQRRTGRAIKRRRYALRAFCIRLRAVGCFIRNRRNKTKRTLAKWLLVGKSGLSFHVVCLIGDYCWKDGWSGIDGGGGGGECARVAVVEAEAAATADDR